MCGVQGKTVQEKTIQERKTPEETHSNQDEREKAAILASEKRARAQASDECEERCME